jgi:ABC-type multidrug transport system fused ATPase/permease subunit
MASIVAILKIGIGLFPKKARHRILLSALIQVVIGLLDLAGVAAMGLLGALAVTGVQSRPPGDRVLTALEVLNLSNFDFQMQAMIISLLTVGLLVGRTALSIFFTKKTLNFLAVQGANLSKELLARLLRDKNVSLRSNSSHDTIYSLTTGVTAISLGLIASAITFVADFSLLLILFVGMLVVDILLAVLTVLAFSIVGLLLFQFSHKEAADLGKRESTLSIKQSAKIGELIGFYRELVVLNLKTEFADTISEIQLDLARTTGRLNFIPYISKYVLEASMIIIAIGIAGIQFLANDAVHAVSAMAVFMAAGSRIAPSILRLQQGAITMKRSAGQAEPTFELIKNFVKIPQKPNVTNPIKKTFEAKVLIRDLNFSYPNRKTSTLENINLVVNPGEHVALVGPSGSGKSTLVDLILGILEPSTGTIEISDLNPNIAYTVWPGRVAYVPQNVVLRAGTLRSNLVLSLNSSMYSDAWIIETLTKLRLDDLLNSLPQGLESPIFEGGKNLSGGQKQRIGVARALISSPKLLILDEATSSLDSQTESEISKVLANLPGNLTLISIAHRLSTIKTADRVIYLDQGKITALGTFEEVRSQVKNFDTQAKLLGLI